MTRDTRTGLNLTAAEIDEARGYLSADRNGNTTSWFVGPEAAVNILEYALRVLGRPQERASLGWHYHRQPDGRYMNTEDQYMPIPMDACYVRTPSNTETNREHFGEGNSLGQLHWDPLGRNTFRDIDRITPVYFHSR
jgi:hypothetical protein